MPPESVLVLLSVVLVAVSIVASRLKTSPAILWCWPVCCWL